MYTLTICIGMFLAICGQVREYDYPSQIACEQARTAFSPKVLGDGYAICHPKKEPK